MDLKQKKILEEKARQINASWLETGKHRNEKFFGLFTKKGFSIILWITFIAVCLADIGIFLLLRNQQF